MLSCLATRYGTKATAAVRIAEGVADALALASRYDGPALATFGTSPMRSGNLAVWLANAPAGAIIHCDDDPGGQRAAADLRRAGQGSRWILYRGLAGRRRGEGPCGRRRPFCAAAAPSARMARLRCHIAGLQPDLGSVGSLPAGWSHLRYPQGQRVNMTAHDGILAGAELAATGQDYLSGTQGLGHSVPRGCVNPRRSTPIGA